MSSKHKPIYAYCVYHVAVVPKKTAREFYAGMSRSLQRCVEAAAGKIEGVKIGKVEADPDHLYISLFIPPRYSVSEVISQIKMRTHAMIRKAAISKELLDKKDDCKTWCAGYYVSTAQGRNNQEIAEYVRTALADDERMGVRVWTPER